MLPPWATLASAVALLLCLTPPPSSGLACSDLEEELVRGQDNVFLNSTVRRVDPVIGLDSESCLNTTDLPCATLLYALHGTQNASAQSVVEDITVYLVPGTYRLSGRLLVVNSQRVALIGSGKEETRLVCGAFGDADLPCSYMNFQIRSSSYVLVSGLTFTGCGPITSAVYISDSTFVTFENCAFQDNLSPPLLVYSTSPIILNKTSFINNHPQELNETITTDICYFSGGIDVFFLDNRTSSGGVSHYTESLAQKLLITNCLFWNNSARPDEAVSLPRESEGYGHGGALNLRFSNSSDSKICIRDSTFENNTAEAQAGAMGITVGRFSSNNNVEVVNCTFCNNSCYLPRCTGGAMGVDFFFNTSFNDVVVDGTQFLGNSADTGGAISLSTSVGTITGAEGESDSLTLHNCQFEQNRAFYEGTALGVFSLTHTDQIGIPINITDCTFKNNAGTHDSTDTTAVTAYRVLMTFLGSSTFLNNRGGGVTLLGSRMDILGHVLFDKNFAVFGAGIAMSGRSLLLLYPNAFLQFTNNVAVDEGAGIYVEYTSSDFVLAVLNRGCFIQYFTTAIDIPPNQWNASVEFINNTAGIAGAAIYANDMSRCKWLGPNNYTEDFFIFNTPDNSTPFVLWNNTVHRAASRSAVSERNTALATDASIFTATTDYGDSPVVGFGEKVSFRLFSSDQFQNFRETVWSVNAPLETQPLGALSSNGTGFEYEVPALSDLQGLGGVRVEGENATITVEFSLLGSQTTPTKVTLHVQGCHPGYTLDQSTQKCTCDLSNSIIVQCDGSNRYFFAREGYWVGLKGDDKLIYSTTVPGFLNCTRRGALPGCEIRYDSLDEQCAPGREGTLCGECQEGYGVTFDLRFCRDDCGAGGIAFFVVICVLTVVLSLLVLYFDFPLPDELKGVIFFAQVIGVIYRNTPYLLGNSGPAYQFFDTLINLLGFSLPFRLCPMENFPALAMAVLGFIPPLLATSVAIAYICLARRFRFLSNRKRYGFNGFHFLYLFVYKYFVDTSFIFLSCTLLDDQYVFTYQGTLQCFQYPFVLLFTLGSISLLLLGLALPAGLILLIYRPGKYVQAADALTRGLKNRRRYRWYGVWDIWRRIMFVAANLFISITTRNVVLLIHCLLVMLCLVIICFVKPYKKLHNNISEALIILCLFGATLAILDDDDVHVGTTAGIVLSVLPFLYGLLFIGYVVVRKLWQYMWSMGCTERWQLEKKLEPLRSRYRRVMENKAVASVIGYASMVVGGAQDERDPSTEVTGSTGSSSRDSRENTTGRGSGGGGEGGGGREGQGTDGLEMATVRTSTISCVLREPLLEDPT